MKGIENLESYFCETRQKKVWKIPEATLKGFVEVSEGDFIDLTFLGSKTRRGRLMANKSNCLTASNYDYCKVTPTGFVKLNPIECERLQTVPDNYTNTSVPSMYRQKKRFENMEQGINVLSLFDGMSCGQIALQRAGIKVDKYFAAEIDKHAIKVTQHNFPETVQLGSVTEVAGFMLPKIDLVIGGSPCQGFSFAGKQLNFDDPRSKLFFEFVRLVNELKPKYFMLENVKMKKEYENIITELLGVKPIEINSALVSAQNRKRLYWTNIPGVTQPEDRGIMLKDIVHEGTVDRDKSYCLDACYYKNGGPKVYYEKGRRQQVFEELARYIVPFDKTLQILEKEVARGKVGFFRKDSQANRVYYIHDKAVTLCGDAGGGAAKMGQYLFGCITPDRIDKRQNGQRFSDGKKFYTLTALTAQDKHGILIEGYIRKLTPVECERLQTVKDGYTAPVSDSQRYRMLGNGWTIEVVAGIFENIKYEHLY